MKQREIEITCAMCGCVDGEKATYAAEELEFQMKLMERLNRENSVYFYPGFFGTVPNLISSPFLYK